MTDTPTPVTDVYVTTYHDGRETVFVCLNATLAGAQARTLNPWTEIAAGIWTAVGDQATHVQQIRRIPVGP